MSLTRPGGMTLRRRRSLGAVSCRFRAPQRFLVGRDKDVMVREAHLKTVVNLVVHLPRSYAVGRRFFCAKLRRRVHHDKRGEAGGIGLEYEY